jgi:hypothetical protein
LRKTKILNEIKETKPGQSVLGCVLVCRIDSNVPAHSSLLVRNGDDKLKIFLTVAGIEECSNSDVGNGLPFGP